MTSEGTISLRPATANDRPALEALTVAPEQLAYINTVADAYLEAAEEPGGRAIQFGLYDDETLVGFVMISDEVDGPPYIAHFLWKLLIDRRFQRRGYGSRAVDLVADYFRARGVGAMWTSTGEGADSPLPFYERCGFVRAGMAPWDEVLLRLDL
jgi:diamine N-acetyltransferase